MKIEGSNVIVTGGAQGFGQAFTEALLIHGAKVCFADINEEIGRNTEAKFHKTYDKSKCFFVRCDISKEAEFNALFEKAVKAFGHLDMVVNNAGILNELNVTKTIEVNLLGTITGTNLAIKYMRKDKGGKGGLVINMASIAGLSPVFFMPAYSASKHGVVAYTKSWAVNPLSQSQYGMNFACMCPAFTDTQMTTGALNAENPPLVTFKENKTAILALINKMGINTVASVTNVFMELVQKEDNNGNTVVIDAVKGVKYV